MSDPNSSSPHDPPFDPPFYVGYLPVPAPLRRFLGIAAPLAAGLVIIAALAASVTQRDPGPARWNDGVAQQFRGHLIRWPYPILLVSDDSAKHEASMYLLVEMGKHGAERPKWSRDGVAVFASGWKLDRDGRQMIELEPASDALREDTSIPRLAVSSPVQIGTVTLKGEIVDSKCYLGAMKPGEGKTHKACATLCIKGGIPPVLVTRDASGRLDHILLCSETGEALGSEIWPFIADPVAITGELEVWHGLKRLRVSAGGIHSL
ncbi:MAG: hypothetical protein KF805_00315 [Phycisphaeraceae bacterium]|nr:hypothetical protein [Phycisphaeraceae bacterium]